MMPHPRRVLWLGAVASPPEASLAARVRDHLALRGWFVEGPHPVANLSALPPDAAAFALVHCWGMASVAACLPALLAMRDAGRAVVLTPLMTETAATGVFPFPDAAAAPHADVREATHRLERLRQAFALTQVAHLLPATPEAMAGFRRAFPAGDHLPVTTLPPDGDTDAAIGATAAAVAAVYDDVAVMRVPATGRASDAYSATLEEELGRDYAARAAPDRDTEALEAEVAWYRDLVEGGEVWREWRRAEAEAAERLAHIIRLNAALTVVREGMSRDHAIAIHGDEQRDLLVAALLEAREERDQSAAQVAALERERDAAKRERDQSAERAAAQVVAQEQEREVVERERDAAKWERNVARRERDAVERQRNVARRERDAAERQRVGATRALIASEAANVAWRDARATLEEEVRWRSEAMDALVAERDWLRSRIPPAPPTMRERVGRAVRVRRPPKKAGTRGTNAAGTRECAS